MTLQMKENKIVEFLKNKTFPLVLLAQQGKNLDTKKQSA